MHVLQSTAASQVLEASGLRNTRLQHKYPPTGYLIRNTKESCGFKIFVQLLYITLASLHAYIRAAEHCQEVPWIKTHIPLQHYMLSLRSLSQTNPVCVEESIFLLSPSGGAVQLRQSLTTHACKIQYVRSIKPNKMNTKQDVDLEPKVLS